MLRFSIESCHSTLNHFSRFHSRNSAISFFSDWYLSTSWSSAKKRFSFLEILIESLSHLSSELSSIVVLFSFSILDSSFFAGALCKMLANSHGVAKRSFAILVSIQSSLFNKLFSNFSSQACVLNSWYAVVSSQCYQ